MQRTSEVLAGARMINWSGAIAGRVRLVARISERVRGTTLCLETALARYGLIDSIPAAIDVAIPRGSTRPALKAPCRLHQFDPRTFELGRETLNVGGRIPIGIYSPERSLIDIVRVRHLQGSDVA